MREDINPVLKVYAWLLFASACVIAAVVPLILHEVFGTILSIVLSVLTSTINICTLISSVKRRKQKSMGAL